MHTDALGLQHNGSLGANGGTNPAEATQRQPQVELLARQTIGFAVHFSHLTTPDSESAGSPQRALDQIGDLIESLRQTGRVD